jgi:Arc/MetJ-type ribon-helix-helix transcriptional regulator
MSPKRTITVHLPEDGESFVLNLKAVSKRNGRSMSSQVIMYIREGLRRDEQEERRKAATGYGHQS